LLGAQSAVDDVRVEDDVLDYLHRLILATRRSPTIRLGASTRAALALERSARAHALVDGRSYVLPDDVRALAVPSLAHRIQVVDPPTNLGRRAAESAIESVLEAVRIPT
jgi:MoxR-like ATPase